MVQKEVSISHLWLIGKPKYPTFIVQFYFLLYFSSIPDNSATRDNNFYTANFRVTAEADVFVQS